MFRAAALITGPILFAALLFQVRAPGRGPGVYVEVESDGEKGTYAVPGYDVDAVPAASDVAMRTLAIPHGVIRSFFTVDLDQSTDAASPVAPGGTFWIALPNVGGPPRACAASTGFITIRPIICGALTWPASRG